MTRFPIEYEVELERGSHSPIELHAGRRARLLAGPPPEFGGTESWWSPEHLLVSALSACFATTFFALAERAHLHVGAYHAHAKGILDRTDEAVRFTSFVLAVRVRVPSDETPRVRALLEDAKKRCFVSNSLRCPVELSAEVDPS